jgi:hypothetical protein
MAQPNLLQAVLSKVVTAFSRLESLTSPARGVAFFRELGYDLPPASVSAGLPALAASAKDLSALAGPLSTAHEDADVATQILKALAGLSGVTEAIQTLHGQLQAAAVAGIAEFKQRLTDFLLIDHLRQQSPRLIETLSILGLIDEEKTPPPGQPKVRIRFDRIGPLLTDPRHVFDDAYQWETNFNAERLLSRLEAMMRSAMLPGGFYSPSTAIAAALGITDPALRELRLPIFQKGLTAETFSQFGITFTPAPAQDAAKPGLALQPFITGAATFGFNVCDRGELTFESTADIRGVGIVIRPPFSAEGVLNVTGPFHASITIREKKDKAEELILFGSRGGTRLSLQGLGMRWFADGSREKLDLGVEATIDAVRLVIAGGEGDGFLNEILSGVKADAQAAVGFGVTLNSGFTFRGGGKLALDIGMHVDVGSVHISGLRLALDPSAEGFALESGAILKFDLGPMTAVAENIGVRSKLSFKPGNLGPVDLDVGFLPPTGIGLSMDAGGFKGGGYLRFDEARGEYAGALELDFKGLFSVKAVGIINTKMPDGGSGFSMLVVIAAEFVPIQLSFGFTLNGVGGLFGLNRTISVNALAEGIRTNAIKSILFPEDIVANITRIISDIRQFFPPQKDYFVVGPMMKLGWGTPSIITAELGLLLNLPDPMFAIVGVLRAMLPAEDAPILRLQVNFIGVLDFERGYLFYRADLYDSRLLVYSITGSMALLVSWGQQQNFALSVGGFHPDFHDIPTIPALPDGFRNMARIGISLLSDDNPRLKVESYFAVTSNTVQFGARVELYAGVGSFNVYGFIGYDVLFQFEPFRFIAKLYGGIALREDDNVLAGINITAQLAGPTPWDARGTASLTILLIDIDVDFHVTWGDPPPAIAPQTEDLLDLLRRQLADTRNWRADLPPQNHLHVSLRTLEPPKSTEPLIIHPAGVLSFSQRAMPLDGYLIEKFGSRKPLADNQFTLSDANANGLAMPGDFLGVREQFAPAQFTELTDSQKLSRHSFEQLPSGFSLTGTSNLQIGQAVSRPVDYELSYLRRKPVRTVFKGLLTLGLRAYQLLVRGSAVRQSALAKQQVRVSMNAPPPVAVPREEFTVAGVADLKQYARTGEAVRSFSTQTEAYQYQQSLIQRDPALAGQIQVVSQFELAS